MPIGKTISKERLAICFENNPNGSGLMWKTSDKHVHYIKGYVDVDTLYYDLLAIGDTVERAIHCRIATSGKIGGECCHPFPVTNDLKQMTLLTNSLCAKTLVMHNGIIDFCTPSSGMTSPYSDTMFFSRDYLFPLEKMLTKGAIKNLMEYATNSRLLLFSELFETQRIGKWECEDGIYYSNSTYKYSHKAIETWSKTMYSEGMYLGNILLTFNFKAYNISDAEDKMYAILESLDYDEGVFPDCYSGEDSFTFVDNVVNFSVVVDSMPKMKLVLNKYAYTVDKYEQIQIDNPLENYTY